MTDHSGGEARAAIATLDARRLRKPRSLRGLAIAGVGLAVVLALDFTLDALVPDSSLRQLMMLAACNILVALSLNIINGMAGQFSIGHAGFLGLGGYTSAIVASHLHQMLGAGTPTFAKSFIVVPLSLLAAASVGGIFGLFVGLPSLRLKGDYLAIVTLGFGEIVPIVARNTPYLTNGAQGLNGVNTPKLFGYNFGVLSTPY